MRAEHALRTMPQANCAAVADLVSSASTASANRSLRSVASLSQRVVQLISRAMAFLETDRRAAWTCLRDAAVCLGESQECGLSPRALATTLRPGGLARWQAIRVLAHIEANLGAKMEVKDLAELVSFSKSHFARAFKQSLGESPMAYIMIRRVERAKVLMTSTPDQLTEIALDCGFADQPHLIRSFRRKVGMSPGLWRRSQAVPLAPAGRAQSERGSHPDM